MVPDERAGNGRVALITAAARGIGGAIAQALASDGYRLALLDVDGDGLASLVAELPTGALATVADVRSDAAVQQAVDETIEHFGRIDALVNVAGGSRPGKTITDVPPEEWAGSLQLNLTSVYLTCRHAIPHIVRGGGGAVVNIASGAGINGMAANPAYCAAKAGVIGLTRALAIDHSRDGLRVNCVAPGPIRTPLMERNRSADEIAVMGSISLLDRVGEPHEIADVVRWLLSDASSYVVGQTIAVDGGVASWL